MHVAKTIFGLSLVLVSAPALSQTWRQVSKVGQVLGYIDTDSLKRDGDKVRFRMEVRFPITQGTPAGRRYDRIASLVEIDCRVKTYRLLRIGAKVGEISVFGGKSPDRSANPIRPGTAADDEMRAVCSDQWPSGA